MRLTKNFSLLEYCVSEEHSDLARALNPSPYVPIIQLHSELVMQPIRTVFDGNKNTITTLSGLRSRRLNSEIGGSQDSDHLYGTALDFTADKIYEMYIWCIYSKLPYRQLIWYPKKNFIHLSINIPGRPYKNDTLVKTSKGYTNFNKGA